MCYTGLDICLIIQIESLVKVIAKPQIANKYKVVLTIEDSNLV